MEIQYGCGYEFECAFCDVLFFRKILILEDISFFFKIGLIWTISSELTGWFLSICSNLLLQSISTDFWTANRENRQPQTAVSCLRSPIMKRLQKDIRTTNYYFFNCLTNNTKAEKVSRAFLNFFSVSEIYRDIFKAKNFFHVTNKKKPLSDQGWLNNLVLSVDRGLKIEV